MIRNPLKPSGENSKPGNAGIVPQQMGRFHEAVRIQRTAGSGRPDARYAEAPEIVIRQMRDYLSLPPQDSPRAVLERQAGRAERAYETLLEKLDDKEKKKLEKHYGVLVNLGGYREIHKYYLVYAGNKIRKKPWRLLIIS